jgi:ribosomal protein S14
MDGVLNKAVSRIDAPRTPHRGTLESFRCRQCGEVIGVYEPLVACREQGARTTSRAAEPGLRAGEGAYYHGDCYAAMGEATRAPERREASGR